MNDTMGTEGLVPSLLVFHVISSLPSFNKNCLNRAIGCWMAVVLMARAEMYPVTAEVRICELLDLNYP